MRFLLPVVILSDMLLTTGCSHFSLVNRQPTPSARVSTPLPASSTLPPLHVQPAVAAKADFATPQPASAFKRYHVGPLVENSGNGRGAGSYYVREQPDHYMRNGVPLDANSGPVTTWRDAAHNPSPLPAEIRDTLAEAQRTMTEMAAENARLAAQLAAAQKAAAAAPSPAAGAGSDNAKNLAPEGAQTAAAAAAPLPIESTRKSSLNEVQILSFKPNSDNLIEITPELAFRTQGTPRVPFDQVYFPKPVLRETVFALTLVSPGSQPSAVINKRIIGPGDTVDGFALKAPGDVDEEGIWLTREFFRVRIPFQETPVTVRYPQP